MRKVLLSLIAAGLVSGCRKEKSLDQTVNTIILSGPCVSEGYSNDKYRFDLRVEEDFLGTSSYSFVCRASSLQVDQKISIGDEVQVLVRLNQRGSSSPITIGSGQIYKINKKP